MARLKIVGVGGVVLRVQSGQSGGHQPVPCMTDRGGLASDGVVPFDDGLDSKRGGGLVGGGVE